VRISLGPTVHLVSVVVSVTALLGACSSARSASPSAQPTISVRPAVPDGWSTIASDEGDVRLVLPPDATIMLTAGSVLAQGPFYDGAVSWEVWATGPPALIDQPRAGQSIVDWLGQSGWMPKPAKGLRGGPTSERETILPAGRALEVATSLQPGTPDEGRAIVYAIETGGGLAVLRFVGTPAVLEERALDLQLMSQLVEFGSQPEQSNP